MGHGAMWCLMLMALYMLSLVIEASIVVLLKVAREETEVEEDPGNI